MHTVKHKLRHPVTLVATVLGLVALLSAAAFALPAETTADQAATTAPTVDQTAFHQASAARAASAFDREVRQDEQARRSEQYRLLAAHGQAEALRAAARARAEAAREAAEAAKAERQEAAAPAASSGRCGGNLPPCCVMQRESGGSLTAHNPSSSASGKWQFLDSTWNGYGGYASAADAPESVQDQKAAQLWAGGSGASHWGGGC